MYKKWRINLIQETIILQRKNTYRFLFLPLLVERKIDGITNARNISKEQQQSVLIES
ncbi:hypothetical protein [Niallia circulans]|uniref:hypothetical protein n=1 Tax=Niallia circulans TaxID=1397 RepID=UPI003514F41E